MATQAREFADQFDAYCIARDEAKAGEPRFIITFDGRTWLVADRKPNFRSSSTEVYEITASGETLHA